MRVPRLTLSMPSPVPELFFLPPLNCSGHLPADFLQLLLPFPIKEGDVVVFWDADSVTPEPGCDAADIVLSIYRTLFKLELVCSV